MSTSSNVSFLAQTASQIDRLKGLRAVLDDLQRQVTTQKKHQTYSGFGAESLRLQSLRSTLSLTETYLGNIGIVTTRMEMMSDSMTQISKLGSQLLSAIRLGGTSDTGAINRLARQSLDFAEELINQKVDGRHLFGGSDALTAPFADDSTLNSNFANQISLWLAGGGTAQLTAAADGFAGAGLGLSSGLPDSGALTARISDALDIDYTVKADESGFQDILRGLAFFANLKYPDPAAGDLATAAEFEAAVGYGLDTLTRGVQEMNESTKQLASKFALIKDMKESLQSDKDLLTTQVDGLENADPSTAIITMQMLQNQLTASYEVTKIVSQLSLVNYL